MIAYFIAFIYGVVIGVLAAYLVAYHFLTRQDRDWRQICADVNDKWRKFHSEELDKWTINTNELLERVAKETADERDKAWRLHINGGKPLKPPKPGN